MNFSHSENHNSENANPRPFGWWLRTVDALITREFATAFEAEGVTRRDWMLLGALAGDIEVPGSTERWAERIARKPHRLRGLAERGWVAQQDGTWVITDEGRAARARLSEVVDGIRSRVAGAVSPEDFATTMASLEAIARELGGDEPLPLGGRGRGFGHRGRGRGFGHDDGHGFGHGRGYGYDSERRHGHRHVDHEQSHDRGFDRAHGHGHVDHEQSHGHDRAHEHDFAPRHGHASCEGPHGHRHDHPRDHFGHGHGGRGGERAYERGFDAGFSRGQAGSGSSDAA